MLPRAPPGISVVLGPVWSRVNEALAEVCMNSDPPACSGAELTVFLALEGFDQFGTFTGPTLLSARLPSHKVCRPRPLHGFTQPRGCYGRRAILTHCRLPAMSPEASTPLAGPTAPQHQELCAPNQSS